MSNAAVIINEFGDVSLDHDLVEKTDGDVVEVTGGCLCCTVRGDPVKALRNLMLKRAKGEIKSFDRVVIETTGLADPAPVLHTFMSSPLAFDKFRLDGVISVVDSVNGDATLTAHEEAVKQAAVADRILLTKADLPESGERIAALTTRLRRLNPGADVLTVAQGRIDPADILNLGPFDSAGKGEQVEAWLKSEAFERDEYDRHDHGPDDVNRHDALIRAFSYVREAPVKLEGLQFLLQLLATMRGQDFLRVKEIVNVQDAPETPAVLHGVQHLLHPIAWLKGWPSPDHRARLVFIVRHMDAAQIAALMESLDDGGGWEPERA